MGRNGLRWLGFLALVRAKRAGDKDYVRGKAAGDASRRERAGECGALFGSKWQRAASPYRLATKAGDGGLLMQTSHNILLAHEDKTYSGAFVASASIPWGQSKGDDDLGGYHLVWTRDMVQTASALLACGRVDTARRALVYLACTQRPDGSFAQNFWIDGRPYWTGVQLDEVAFPLILTWRIWKAGGLGSWDVFPFVERAAGFLVRHAPITHQERWEENSGYSPSTLAAVIGGLICAAEIAREHQSLELADFLEQYADWIELHLEDWTVTNDGVLLEGVKRHYMRIRPPENGEAIDREGPGWEQIHINNRPPGTRYDFEAREIIDGGFLELVRYGIRRADDPLMVDSLKVVDAVLKRDLPQGPGWLRYNWDGYGNGFDGGPFHSYGQGRVWPLLTGERAHVTELAAGHDIQRPHQDLRGLRRRPAICFPSRCGIPPTGRNKQLTLGGPTGSACPLVWAHAEYLKLLRSALDGKVFDRIEPVYRRYGRFQSEHNHARSEHHDRVHLRCFPEIFPASAVRFSASRLAATLPGSWTIIALSSSGPTTAGRPIRRRKAAAWAAPDSPRTSFRGLANRPLLYHLLSSGRRKTAGWATITRFASKDNSNQCGRPTFAGHLSFRLRWASNREKQNQIPERNIHVYARHRQES